MPRSLQRRRLWIAGIAAIVLVVVGGLLLYTSSWRTRESVRAIGAGLRPLRLSTDTERLVIPDGPRLVGEYYRGSAERPLIVLAHGSSHLGRRHPVVRVLATRLRQTGFSVLAIDLRGFGESDKPPPPLERNLDFETDLIRAADVARRRGLAGGGGIVYMGHSLGAGVALRAATLEPQPRGVVALGAPHTVDRFRRQGRQWLDAFASQRLRDMRLPARAESVEAVGRYLIELDLVDQAGRSGNPPVLVVRGEREDWSAIGAEMERLSRADSTLSLLEIADANHRYMIRSGPRGLDVAFHDPRITSELVQAMADWILELGGASETRTIGMARTRQRDRR